jgi:hypothetical protein
MLTDTNVLDFRQTDVGHGAGYGLSLWIEQCLERHYIDVSFEGRHDSEI